MFIRKKIEATEDERLRAERVSEAVNQLITDPDIPLDEFGLDDTSTLAVAQQFARLPTLLGSVDTALEQRVMQQVRKEPTRTQRLRRIRPGWAFAGLAAFLLAMMLFTPLGQTAVASFMAVFSLGRTEVRITPVDTPSAPVTTAVVGQTAIRQRLTMREARDQLPFALPQPTYVPAGYQFGDVVTYSYPDLPAWIPQPFFAELVYRDQDGDEVTLRVYPIMLGDDASISGLNLRAAPIQDVQDVDVNDQPAVLMRLGGKGSRPGWQEVVWEHGDLILALSSAELSEDELLQIARSVH